MTRSSQLSSMLPTLALAVAMGSLFAPPVMGLMGATPRPAPRQSALLIEAQEPVAVASVPGGLTRVPRGAAAQCHVVGSDSKAPPPPSVRTVVADLGERVAR